MTRTRPDPTVLLPDEARAFLVAHHGLRRTRDERDAAAAVRALLAERRCIQLDPLDAIGTNADLVAMARIDGLARGDVHRHLFPGHAFEHFAKERCILPASAFAHYRDQAAETPLWRLGERLKRLPAGVIDAVRDEIRARGPVSARALADRGRVDPLEWAGWSGTARAAAMAVEVLWTRCEVVVAGRAGRDKLYDVPERALPAAAGRSPAPAGTPDAFARWALIERVEAAGLLSRAAGPMWSMLASARTSALPDALVDEGVLEEVVVPGSPRRYLAPRGFRGRAQPASDGRVRVLGPLDSVLWDRALVKSAFGFDYTWEVYKPASQRQYGWYVCPLLHGDALVGRLEAEVARGALRVRSVWREKGAKLPADALAALLARHAASVGVARVVMPRRGVRSA
jgi:uncharacterized protein YcaQ